MKIIQLSGCIALVTFIMSLSSMALATNGMENISSGGRAAGMGGADLAVATDATAMNTNPAGLIQTKKHRVDLGFSMMIPPLHFKNSLNGNVLNDKDGGFQVFPMATLAYAYKFDNVPVALGVGMFTQGGMGAKFKLFHPVINPTEEQDYRSMIGYGKFTTSVAYQPHPIISIGLSVNLGVAMMNMKMPFAVKPSMMAGVSKMNMGKDDEGNDVIVPITYATMFGGMLGYDELSAVAELENSFAFGFGGKLGVMLNPHKMVSIGITYTMKSKLKFKGRASMDMNGQFDDAMPKMFDAFAVMPTNIGASKDDIQEGMDAFFTENHIDATQGYAANYDASIDFAWPRKVGLGFAIKPIDTVLIAVDVHWVNWEDSMKTFKMVMTNGDNTNINNMIGSDRVNANMAMNWSDQFPVAIGVEWEFMDGVFARTGYNYGKNPVPSDTVTPIFPAIVEHHITFGGGYNHNDFFEINFAYEIALPNTQDTVKKDHLVASEYNGSKSTLSEHIITVMGSFTL